MKGMISLGASSRYGINASAIQEEFESFPSACEYFEVPMEVQMQSEIVEKIVYVDRIVYKESPLKENVPIQKRDQGTQMSQQVNSELGLISNQGIPKAGCVIEPNQDDLKDDQSSKFEVSALGVQSKVELASPSSSVYGYF